MPDGLSNPLLEGTTLTAECGGTRINLGLLVPSRRKANITLLVDSQDGDKVAAYATDKLSSFSPDLMLAHYVNWQRYGA